MARSDDFIAGVHGGDMKAQYGAIPRIVQELFALSREKFLNAGVRSSTYYARSIAVSPVDGNICESNYDASRRLNQPRSSTN